MTMATKKKSSSASAFSHYTVNPKVRRPGVHAKTKTSKSKNATNYKKLSVGQG